MTRYVMLNYVVEVYTEAGGKFVDILANKCQAISHCMIYLWDN